MGLFRRRFAKTKDAATDTSAPFSPPPYQEAALPAGIYAGLERNLDLFRKIFHSPKNSDFIIRQLQIGQDQGAVCYIDGMAGRMNIEDMVLRPLQEVETLQGRPSKVAQQVMERIIPAGNVKILQSTKDIRDLILLGNVAIFIDGCPSAVVCEMIAVQKRGVEQPVTETTVIGPNQAFNENIRSNISLLRSQLKSADLVSEMLTVGEDSQMPVAVMYMENITNPSIVSEVKRRIGGIQKSAVLNSGELSQLIEDKPFALLPQTILTERPDRAASFLMDGMVVIVCDNSPQVIGAPATFFHLMHTSEDSFMRWQYGSFTRIIRFFGALTAMLMPALYCALMLYHQELLPSELLTSLIEGHVLVPFSVTAELVFMTLIFDLINEASLRMPGYMGSTLGIIGALVLGQAAVAANLFSPALIIIVSITGLGTFSVPSYPLSVALRIRRYAFIFAAATFGFVGIALLLVASLYFDCALESFGVPVMSPLAPNTRHNPDIVLRLPIFLQRMIPGMNKARKKNIAPNPRGWE